MNKISDLKGMQFKQSENVGIGRDNWLYLWLVPFSGACLVGALLLVVL